MKFTTVDVPTVRRGRQAIENPFIDIVAELADAYTNGKTVAKSFVEQGDKTDVARWFRQLTAAGQSYGVSVRRTVEPKPSTPKTPGADDTTERTVTFWLARNTKPSA